MRVHQLGSSREQAPTVCVHNDACQPLLRLAAGTLHAAQKRKTTFPPQLVVSGSK